MSEELMFVKRSSLQSVADKIKAKAGTDEKMVFPEEWETTIDAIASGGDTSVEDGLIDNTLTEYTNNTVTSIASRKFYESNLKKVTFGAVTDIGTHAFQNCDLETASFPALVKVPHQSFQYCGFSKIKADFFPVAETIAGNYVFANCLSLRFAEFSKVKSIGYVAFRDCKVLDTLILRSEILCALTNTQNFLNTPIANGMGYVYIPKTLLEEYKVATNWVTYADQIRAYEDWENILEITSQPTDITAVVNTEVTFSVKADGIISDYRWQTSKDGGVTWGDNSGTLPNYSTTAKEKYNGYMVRCILTNINGQEIISNTATLTVITT